MSSKFLPWLGIGAAVSAVGLVVGVSVTSGVSDTLPVAQAAPTTLTTSASASATSETATTTATTSATSTSTTSTSGAPVSYQADAKGYVDTLARCDENQTLMAYGRTTKSLVVICVNRDGGLEYRGVRLSDNAPLHLPITRSSDGTLVASNDGVTYAVSPTQILVSSGDDVIYKDSWIEFKEASFSQSSTSSSATTSGSATTTVSTTTVTVTSSVTPTTTKPGG
ncbi:hypothetical protein FHT40_003599 [Mycolicibacterium sp. BK556]|uniref:hypothetical protein n=1 Tax=Mycobacteriaceae TaxID=1762 RepID=UPI0010DACE92|nr:MULTISPECIES: hypothetical protein [Mycobacteriaceae]MBB3603938.1 hypothetical protein [Mycolicibacterium sp. BK556]MBB3634133.1 hypothetical protein [Mycolicibacterium sp. BK607]MBB3751715.1 hypothetical protein [Mycolicibacterium sp. BK634]TDO12228.1 hypothetical protein EV580_3954 [Mycobacterium sp. BK086]